MFRWTDYETIAKPQSVYAKIFGAKREYEYALRKATYRGGTGSRLHMIQNLTPQESAHFLLHDAHGRQLRRDFSDVPFNDLVGYVCEASKRTQKREVKTMDKHLEVILKSESAMHALCKHIAANDGSNFTHPQFDDMLARYAKNQHPTVHVGSAIAKVLAEETPVAKAYQAVHSFYKAEPVVDDDEDEDESDTDALAELEELAREEQRRTNGMSKYAAFAKVYQDHPELAARERRQNRPR